MFPSNIYWYHHRIAYPFVPHKKIEFVVNSTSVVSSSFRMTITAIESIRRGRHLASSYSSLLLRGGGRGSSRNDDASPQQYSRMLQQQQMQQQPTLSQKEEPAIIEQLSRVYKEVLTIAPMDISLVYEEELEVEYLGAEDSKGGGGGGRGDKGGVIRKSVFRVMGE